MKAPKKVVRTKMVELDCGNFGAYKYKLAKGGSAIRLVNLETQEVYSFTKDKRSGGPVAYGPPAKFKELDYKPLYEEATSKLKNVKYGSRGIIKNNATDDCGNITAGSAVNMDTGEHISVDVENNLEVMLDAHDTPDYAFIINEYGIGGKIQRASVNRLNRELIQSMPRNNATLELLNQKGVTSSEVGFQLFYKLISRLERNIQEQDARAILEALNIDYGRNILKELIVQIRKSKARRR